MCHFYIDVYPCSGSQVPSRKYLVLIVLSVVYDEVPPYVVVNACNYSPCYAQTITQKFLKNAKFIPNIIHVYPRVNSCCFCCYCFLVCFFFVVVVVVVLLLFFLSHKAQEN